MVHEQGEGELDGTRRPLRADARRNRKRILAAAAEAFATRGLAVPIDLVAERAGVGVGTLYRHFPTKEALFAAVVGQRVAALAAALGAAGAGDDTGSTLFTCIELLAVEVVGNQDLLEALEAAGVDVTPELAQALARLEREIDDLLRRAAAAGAVRADVSPEDVLGLVIGTCRGARQVGGGDERIRRLVSIVCEGLRTPGERVL